MTRAWKVTQVLLMVALSSTAMGAQEPSRLPAGAPPAAGASSTGSALGLDEAIARALARQPELREAQAQVAVALGLERQAAARPNPMATVERRVEPRGTDALSSVGVSWPLDLFRRHGRLQTAAQEVVVARLAVTDRERVLAGSVRLQYGATAAAVRDAEVAGELLAVATEELRLAQARAAEGAGRTLDAGLMEVDVRRLQGDQAMAQGRAEVSLLQLRQLLGMRPDEPLAVRDGIEALVGVGPGGGAAVTSGRESVARTDVREADARVRAADARVEQARREGRVDVSLYGTYMRMDAGFPQSAFGPGGVVERVRGQFNYVAGGATVSLPFLNRNQGLVASAQAERAGAEARREATVLAAQTEAAVARARDVRARQALAAYQGDTQALARRNLEVVRQARALGRGSASDVLMEQRRYLEFERAYTAALREVWEARAGLALAMGEGQ